MATIIYDLGPQSLSHWPPPAFDEHLQTHKGTDLPNPGYREPTIPIFQGHLTILYILVQGLAGPDKHHLLTVVAQRMTN